MKVTWPVLTRMKLDPTYGLLNAKSVLICLEVFNLLDSKNVSSLDDIQFQIFLTSATDLTDAQAQNIFDIFDLDRSGSVEFDEFYLLAGLGKTFMYQHWRTCFELLDEDGSKAVSRSEFELLGFLFNFSRAAVGAIYKEFDVTGNAELDTSEFRLFIIAAMDLQHEIEVKARKSQQQTPGFMRKVKEFFGYFIV